MTSYLIAIALTIVLGIILSAIAFQGPNAFPLGLCLIIMGLTLVGVIGQSCNCLSAKSGSASLFDPKSWGFIPRGRDPGIGYMRSINPCPPETNLGQYGPAARYDGILITGSPEFVGRTVAALRRLDGLKSYRYALALKTITEARLDRLTLAQVTGRHAEVDPRTSRMSCTIYAGVIVHEGAHVIHGAGHGPVYAAQARALEEMGEPYAARTATQMASKF